MHSLKETVINVLQLLLANLDRLAISHEVNVDPIDALGPGPVLQLGRFTLDNSANFDIF